VQSLEDWCRGARRSPVLRSTAEGGRRFTVAAEVTRRAVIRCADQPADSRLTHVVVRSSWSPCAPKMAFPMAMKWAEARAPIGRVSVPSFLRSLTPLGSRTDLSKIIIRSLS
jgi:hypothetical protein